MSARKSLSWLHAVSVLVCFLSAHARAAGGPLPPGGSAADAACPAGSPSPNGSRIVGPLGGGCTLIDRNGDRWAFEPGIRGALYNQTDPNYASWGFTINGSQVGTWANTLEINSGVASNTLYILAAGPQPRSCFTWVYHVAGGGVYPQVASPTSPALGKIFANTTRGTGYIWMRDLFENASDGDTITIPANVPGICAWNAHVSVHKNNVVVDCAGRAKVYGKIELAGHEDLIKNCDVGYAQGATYGGPIPGIGIAAGYYGARNPALIGVYVHDSDDGILSGGNGSGLITLTNVVAQHNGFYDPSGDCIGYDHNIYLSSTISGSAAPETGSVAINGGASLDVRCKGDPLKLRVNGGTITDYTVGETGKYTDTQMNWPIDLPCGGSYRLSHITIERGPNADNYGMISYGEELPGSPRNWACPPNTAFSGDTIAGRNTITNVSTTKDVVLGALVTGKGMPARATITKITGTTVTLSANAMADQTGASFMTTRDHTLSVSDAIFIDDGPSDRQRPSYVVRCNGKNTPCSSIVFGGAALNVAVSNSVIVDAGTPGCAEGYLGPGVTDGGGNKCYTSRKAAGFAAYPYLPPAP